MKYFLDCEFDKHLGPLISIALICEDGRDLYIITDYKDIQDPWVVENVMPILNSHEASKTHRTNQYGAGAYLRDFLIGDDEPEVISDSTADIAYFVNLYGTTTDGEYSRLGKKRITFRVENVRPYPSSNTKLVRHNAWCDAMALKQKLGEIEDSYPDKAEEECLIEIEQIKLKSAISKFKSLREPDRGLDILAAELLTSEPRDFNLTERVLRNGKRPCPKFTSSSDDVRLLVPEGFVHILENNPDGSGRAILRKRNGPIPDWTNYYATAPIALIVAILTQKLNSLSPSNIQS